MTETDGRPQPKDVDTRDVPTPERMATTGRAVVDAIAREPRGEHEAEQGAGRTVPAAEAERIIGSWPNAPRNLARQMLEKYGPPNEATPTKLFWYRKGPWKRAELTSEVVTHNWPAPHSDFFTQVIDYRVPPEMVHLIAMFDGSILVDRTRGEVSARCDSEAANVLGLNMVHEIVTGKRTVEEARQTSADQTVAYNMGRAAPYAERLQFDLPEGGTEDLDRPMIARAVVQQAAGKLRDLVTGGGGERTERGTGTERDQNR
ncbi:MAG: hypothetical protein M3301_07965 [Chloroflexota bacterium]|nr:hypothetical protein [Chloroflexota bacterium]